MNAPRYQFHDLIATGGMGEVWRATDTALDRPVAIKLLKPEYADDPLSRQRFDSEARHAAALHHPHIAAVYDVGEMPTASGLVRPYLVMELVDGKPLSDLIHTPTGDRALDPDVVRDLLGQAGDGLAAAHRAGIVHRDIKPANMLVTPDRQVKMTDFGIARAAAALPITTTGQVMGTPQYLSPEQARGEQATPASDVYSLGVVAYECLTGTRPFDKETPVATAIAHLHDPVPPLPASVPADLAAVVIRCLSKEAGDRYPDAAAFTAALRGLSGSRTDTPAAGTTVAPVVPVPPAEPHTTVLPADDRPAGSTTVVQRTPSGYVPPEDTPAGPADQPWWRRLGWLNWLLIILALLALIAVLAVLRTMFHSDSPNALPNDVKSHTTGPSKSASSTPKTFDLPTGCYADWQLADVKAALRRQGLKAAPQSVPEEDDKPAKTVEYVTPCRAVSKGQTITVKYFPGPTTTTPTPTSSPTTSPTTTSPTATATATTTVTTTPTSSATTSTSPSQGDTP